MTKSERSLFWVEPAAMAALLERLDAAPGNPAAALLSPAADPRQGGGTEEEGSRLARETAAEDTLGGVREQELTLPQLILPVGSAEQRLTSLLAWIREVAACDQAFVADGEGLILLNDTASAELIAAAAAMGETWESLRRSWQLPQEASLAIDLEDDRRLYLLRATTRWGSLHLGLVTPRPLPRSTLDIFRDALTRSVDDEGAE